MASAPHACWFAKAVTATGNLGDYTTGGDGRAVVKGLVPPYLSARIVQ